MHRGGSGPKLQSGTKRIDRLAQLTECLLSYAQVVVRLGIIRPQPHSLLEFYCRCAVVALPGQINSRLVMLSSLVRGHRAALLSGALHRGCRRNRPCKKGQQYRRCSEPAKASAKGAVQDGPGTHENLTTKTRRFTQARTWWIFASSCLRGEDTKSSFSTKTRRIIRR